MHFERLDAGVVFASNSTGLRRLAVLACVVSSALVASGCGDDSGSGKTTAGTQDVAAADSELTADVTADSSAADAVADASGGMDADGGSAGDGGGDADASAGCEFSATASAGEPGSKCTKPDDCNSGLCIETSGGKVCTAQCTSCCPSGWTCTQLSETDPTYACLPKTVHLCEPCTDDAACAGKGGQALCVDYGNGGRFCGSACASDSDCASGYVCKDAKGTKAEGKQCVLASGECSCSVKATELSAQTACTVSNTFGSCPGTRGCGKEGLTACSAKTPAEETCNDQDDDCDGLTDEENALGCVQVWADADKDGFGGSAATGGTSQCLCKPTDLYSSASATDCNDKDAAVKPDAVEGCDNIDNDCDGATDEGCDDDQDGFCDVALPYVATPTVCPKGGGDCQDDTVAVTGCTVYYSDTDKDGYGVTADSKCLCAAVDLYTAVSPDDCADSDAAVHPAAIELCSNGKDDNCSGAQDEENADGCKPYWADGDADSFGAGVSKCLCGPTSAYPVQKDGDCDDAKADVSPANKESCNGIDDDCDGQVDEVDALGCKPHLADNDKDGFGKADDSQCLCAPLDKYTVVDVTKVDCDDGNANVNPSVSEQCSTFGVDDDCDGQIDETDANGCKVYYADADKDGVGDSAQNACLCAPSATLVVLVGGDCNDNDDKVRPGLDEACGTVGIDDNCDGKTDDEGAVGCAVWQYDGDKDGFGDGVVKQSKCLCAPTGEFSSDNSLDCNDKAPAINPAVSESCITTGVDDNCNGQVDEENAGGCVIRFVDIDKDGFGNDGAPTACLCESSGFYTALVGGDCNDSDVETYPGAKDICNDFGKDANCNGTSNDVGGADCKAFFLDKDQDGFGVTGDLQCMCVAAGDYSASKPGDCDDGSFNVNPSATEICSNAIDDNCNGTVDTDSTAAQPYYIDVDGDGYGDTQNPGVKMLCGPSGDYKALKLGDCNDNAKNINPNQADLCNGVDDDCNGLIDNPGSVSLCQTVANGNWACEVGTCQTKCNSGFFNLDGDYLTGCECAADQDFSAATGHFCATPKVLPTLADTGSSVTVLGNLMPTENGDWYAFTAQDNDDIASGGDKFNVVATFLNNPNNQFLVDIYRADTLEAAKTACANGASFCAAKTQHTWATNFYGATPSGIGIKANVPAGDVVKSPVPEKGGEGKCGNNPGAVGVNVCTNNSKVYIVRVYRAPGLPATCDYYSLRFSNAL